MADPKWATPERLEYLRKLKSEGKGICVLTHKQCRGDWVDFVCEYGTVCYRHAVMDRRLQAAENIVAKDRALHEALNLSIAEANSIFPKINKELERQIEEMQARITANARYLTAALGIEKSLAPLFMCIIPGFHRTCRFTQPTFASSVAVPGWQLAERDIEHGRVLSPTAPFGLERVEKIVSTTPEFVNLGKGQMAHTQGGLKTRLHWQCAWGAYPCYSAIVFDFPGTEPLIVGELVGLLEMEAGGKDLTPYADQLKREWAEADRIIAKAKLEQEEAAMHDLAELPGPWRRGQFGSMQREITGGQTKEFEISTVKTEEGHRVIKTETAFDERGNIRAFVTVRLGGTWEYAKDPMKEPMDPKAGKWGNVIRKYDISDILARAPQMNWASKNAVNKAIRYGKPFPPALSAEIENYVTKLVEEEKRKL